MKKIFQFAIVAVAAVAMASCGNKGTQTTESADSTATEPAVEQKADAPAGEVVAENEYIKVNIPAGWEIENPKVEGDKFRIKLKPGTDLGEWQDIVILTYDKAMTADERVKSCIEGSESSRKVAEDVKYGDVTYKQVKFINSETNCMLYGDMPKGVLSVTLSDKLTVDNPDVKAILGSISFK
jgi:predicted small lipoprotein YifL